MPQVSRQDIKDFDVYGETEIDLSETFQERLMKRFAPHENVQVMNIDDEPIEWQYMPDYAEQSHLTDEGIKITHREAPELWRLDPGESDVITGANAFKMIETLYKKMVVKKVGIVEHPETAKQIRNFNFKDPVRAEQLIDKIYQGKVKPSFNQAEPNKVVPKKSDVKKS